ncbi:hypothetical protein GCM10010404_12400 [Nonomuraea africana]|uniref:Uncharacterized protein n=1 Tax=Nonomuraea africana TaxID=46171 RepID=A0ABR9KAD7_9ACTN|nr:hypothetical protein [Nonomuraea africana]MBE1558522.1 hypothetical protein [Nonomuraea africana]
MSEVVPLPSFGEVFFDARGQERCLRVTWHEGTLVLSLWRGEMCTGSFRMPMDDVGRLLDTLDDGYAEATGEQPAVVIQPPVEVGEYPGTGQYHRPPPFEHDPQRPQHDDRPTATLSPNDVLVARGAPLQPDKLVATTYQEREAPGHQEQRESPAYPEQRETPIGPDGRPRHAEPQAARAADPLGGPGYQMPDYQPASAPQSTDPFGFPGQGGAHQQTPSDPFAAQPQHQSSPRQAPLHQDPYTQPQQPVAAPYTDPFAPPQRAQSVPAAAGLGTPMHGIPGAGRRPAPEPYPQPEPYGRQEQYAQPEQYGRQEQYGQPDQYGRQEYGQPDQYGQQPSYPQSPLNPADPLGLGPDAYLSQPPHQQPPHQQPPYQEPQQQDPSMHRPYVNDPMFVTGERLRPEQQHHDDRTERREW